MQLSIAAAAAAACDALPIPVEQCGWHTACMYGNLIWVVVTSGVLRMRHTLAASLSSGACTFFFSGRFWPATQQQHTGKGIVGGWGGVGRLSAAAAMVNFSEEPPFVQDDCCTHERSLGTLKTLMQVPKAGVHLHISHKMRELERHHLGMMERGGCSG